jgi:hypothetical protein
MCRYVTQRSPLLSHGITQRSILQAFSGDQSTVMQGQGNAKCGTAYAAVDATSSSNPPIVVKNGSKILCRSSNHASQSVSIYFRDRMAEHYQIKVATQKEMEYLSYRLRRRDDIDRRLASVQPLMNPDQPQERQLTT